MIMDGAIPGMPNWLKLTSHFFGIVSPPIYPTIFHQLGMDGKAIMISFYVEP